MIPTLVEGHLDERLLGALWRQLGKEGRALNVRDAGGSPFWEHARRYNEAAKHQTVIGLADLEQSPCASEAFEKLNKPLSQGFKLRLAVRMIESWIMADRNSFAIHLGIRLARVPEQPDLLPHPKRTVVELARHSRKKAVRDALVPTGLGLVGAEYTPFMAGFVESRWRLDRARESSPSLERACLRWSGV